MRQDVEQPAETGLKLKLEVLTDSTANIGTHRCIGLGRVRHLDATGWTATYHWTSTRSLDGDTRGWRYPAGRGS